MRCPRCDSKRIQRDYNDAAKLVHLAGMRKLLCNQCGHVFHGFDPLGRLRRAPSEHESEGLIRRSPRYQVHLPASISIVQGTAREGKVTYSEPSRGHCESISENGMGLSLVGSRFPEKELTRFGSLLFVRVRLPETTIEAVVSVLNHQRIGKDIKKRWLLGVKTQQISPDDKEKLLAYLKQRAWGAQLIVSD